MPRFRINNIEEVMTHDISHMSADTFISEVTREYIKKKDLAFLDWLDNHGYEVRFEMDNEINVCFKFSGQPDSENTLPIPQDELQRLWSVFDSQYPHLTEILRSDSNG